MIERINDQHWKFIKERENRYSSVIEIPLLKMLLDRKRIPVTIP